MAAPLLETKLHVPPIRAGQVPRPRLTARIDAGLRGKLTLVSAPAGFGKTTLLSGWLHQLGDEPGAAHAHSFVLGTAWLSLDEGENDPARFLAYLVAALQSIDPAIGDLALAGLQSPQPPSIESVLTTIINDVASIPGGGARAHELVLILDDYHVISAAEIHDALAFFLDHLPPRLHLIIASRRDPPLPLARLRVSGDMVAIRARDLRFTEEEAAAFLNQTMGLGLAPDEVAALEARTEGWIAGLHLAAIAIQSMGLARPPLSPKELAERSAFISAFAGDDRHVMDYLMNEVLSRQPNEVQRFLLQTAILDRLCGPLCDAVLGSQTEEGRSQAILAELERANLFIVPLDHRRRWYRYHHLFGSLLRHRLRRSAGEQGLASLHRRACRWYDENGFLQDAVGHALAADDVDVAANLVERGARQLFARSELATILRWAEALPDDLVRARPWLCVYCAWALRLTGHGFQAVEGRLRDAESALQDQPRLVLETAGPGAPHLDEPEVERIRGHIASIRAYQALYSEDIDRAHDLARQALERLPEGGFARGLAGLALGWASRFKGDLAGSSRAFTQARHASESAGNIYVAASAVCRLAYSQMLAGHLHQAVESCREAIEFATRKDGRLLPVAGYAYVYIGGVYREWNQPEDATRYLQDGIDLCAQVGYILDQVIGHATVARVRLAQGDRDRAWSAFEKARGLSQRMRGYVYARRWVEDCQVRLWSAEGDHAAAAAWVQESELDVDDAITFHRELEHLILARALIVQGRERPEESGGPEDATLLEALSLLDRLLEVSNTAGWMGKAIEVLTLQAMAYQALGDDERALGALAEALILAEPEGYFRVFVDEGPPMERLLAEAAAREIAPEYVDGLLAAFQGTDRPKSPLRPDERLKSLLQRPGERLKPFLQPTGELVEPLTEREIEVLALVAEGLTNRQIASRLFLSLNTVKTHTGNIYGKLGVNRRTQAVAKARALGILPHA
jgi:LuxR family maltose regulon positive regulatory protein